MWALLVFPVALYGLSLFLFGSAWRYSREYRATKAEGRAANEWAKAPRGKARMCRLYGSLFAVLFLILMWAYFVMALQLAGGTMLLALAGCLVAVVVGGILMGRLKSSHITPSKTEQG
jgi:hypothetical protein